MSDLGYIKNVGFMGSVSLLIGSLTGIVLLPYMFQTAGWLFPVLAIIVVAILTGLATLFVAESCSRFPGNEEFQRNVEYSVLIHQFYGRFWYYIIIGVLYGSLQAPNVASIIGCAQVFDTFFVNVLNTTCGYGVYPTSGFYCAHQMVTNINGTWTQVLADSNSPFGDNWMIFTVGLLVTIMIVVPMALGDLNDNIVLQFISTVYNILFLVTLAVVVVAAGISTSNVPMYTGNTQNVFGTVLFNFIVANTIPSWINVKHPKVSIHKSIWTSICFSSVFFILVGVLGALAFKVSNTENLLQVMLHWSSTNGSYAYISIIYYMFPILQYLGSIMASMIVVRLNFLAAGLCTKGTAQLWAVALPVLACIPFQTGSDLSYFSTWTSIVFQSSCNFLVPFLMYLFLSRRRMVMQQSVIDELEFLDLNAGIKKNYRDDEDDFDYIYHLPYADVASIKYHDPFAPKYDETPIGDATVPMGKRKSVGYQPSIVSGMSNVSKKQLRSLLDPGSGANSVRTGSIKGSHMNLGQSSASLSQGGLSGSRGSGDGGLAVNAKYQYLGQRAQAARQPGGLRGNAPALSRGDLQKSPTGGFSSYTNSSSEGSDFLMKQDSMGRGLSGSGSGAVPSMPFISVQDEDGFDEDGVVAIKNSKDSLVSRSLSKRKFFGRNNSGSFRNSFRTSNSFGGGNSFKDEGKVNPIDFEDDDPMLKIEEQGFFGDEVSRFRALPKRMTKIISANVFAFFGLIITLAMIVQVIVSTVLFPT